MSCTAQGIHVEWKHISLELENKVACVCRENHIAVWPYFDSSQECPPGLDINAEPKVRTKAGATLRLLAFPWTFSGLLRQGPISPWILLILSSMT
jgi:hypothetical protein